MISVWSWSYTLSRIPNNKFGNHACFGTCISTEVYSVKRAAWIFVLSKFSFLKRLTDSTHHTSHDIRVQSKNHTTLGFWTRYNAVRIQLPDVTDLVAAIYTERPSTSPCICLVNLKKRGDWKEWVQRMLLLLRTLRVRRDEQLSFQRLECVWDFVSTKSK